MAKRKYGEVEGVAADHGTSAGGRPFRASVLSSGRDPRDVVFISGVARFASNASKKPSNSQQLLRHLCRQSFHEPPMPTGDGPIVVELSDGLTLRLPSEGRVWPIMNRPACHAAGSCVR